MGLRAGRPWGGWGTQASAWKGDNRGQAGRMVGWEERVKQWPSGAEQKRGGQRGAAVEMLASAPASWMRWCHSLT